MIASMMMYIYYIHVTSWSNLPAYMLAKYPQKDILKDHILYIRVISTIAYDMYLSMI